MCRPAAGLISPDQSYSVSSPQSDSEAHRDRRRSGVASRPILSGGARCEASGHLRFGFKLGPLRVRVACDPRPVSCKETPW
jgi:hypothetical protein